MRILLVGLTIISYFAYQSACAQQITAKTFISLLHAKRSSVDSTLARIGFSTEMSMSSKDPDRITILYKKEKPGTASSTKYSVVVSWLTDGRLRILSYEMPEDADGHHFVDQLQQAGFAYVTKKDPNFDVTSNWFVKGDLYIRYRETSDNGVKQYKFSWRMDND